MKKLITTITIALVLVCSASTKADLVIDVTGVPGSGVTTWVFSTTTPGTVTTGGSIRTNSANTFSATDTGQFPFGQNTILETTIQDQVFAFIGLNTAQITIGGNTQSITGIFLDDDGGSGDDFGVRAGVELPYLAGDSSSWSGVGILNLDINTFVLGPWTLGGQAMFIDPNITINFTAITIPEPTTGLVCCGFAMIGLMVRRRRS